jgi:pimeloyl-ACP methyl ester carboxylesterase/DNA-binding winged helix-turn-helix (wHTH) protein
MRNLPRKMYKFGNFRIDATEKCLFENSKLISITPKAFDCLLLLVENCGHILTKEEIFEKIWQGAFVEENNLAQNISILRRIVGENLIETIPKRGYRFIGEVNLADNETTQTIIHEKIRAKIIYDDEDIDSLPNGINQIIQQLPTNHFASLPAHKPETKYVLNDDVNIAYQVIGNGDLDIVFVMGWVSHLEYFWEEPHFASFLNRLASFSRLILFDKRGTGLSDRVPLNQLPTLEQRMEDVNAVMKAVGSEKAVLIGVSEGGPMCSLFAATYPEKTIAMVMIGSYAKRIKDEEYPWGVDLADREAFFEYIGREWGKPVGIEERAPSLANDEVFRNWWATYLRMGASPGAAVALTKMNAEIDVRSVLPTIRVPTLVIHRQGDLCLRVEEGRFLAQEINGCKYVEFEGIDHLPFVGNQVEILDEIEEFLTGMRHSEEYDRVLATVLCVKSDNWQGLDENSREMIFKQIELFKGQKISFEDDKLLAIFDGPARAVRCANAVNDAMNRFGINTKTGLHTGECDVLGEKVSGIAVELAEQIAVKANLGEIFVSRTIKDLVAGSGLIFDEIGKNSFGEELGEWRIFSVITQVAR